VENFRAVAQPVPQAQGSRSRTARRIRRFEPEPGRPRPVAQKLHQRARRFEPPRRIAPDGWLERAQLLWLDTDADFETIGRLVGVSREWVRLHRHLLPWRPWTPARELGHLASLSQIRKWAAEDWVRVSPGGLFHREDVEATYLRLVERRCESCGNPLRSVRLTQRLCSTCLARRPQRPGGPPRLCKCGCGREVTRRSMRRFATEDCRVQFWKAKRYPPRPTPVAISCACGCGRVIEHPRHNQRWASEACRGRARYRERVAEAGVS
jgi:hypothetical protein